MTDISCPRETCEYSERPVDRSGYPRSCYSCERWTDIDMSAHGTCKSPIHGNRGISMLVRNLTLPDIKDLAIDLRTDRTTYCKDWAERTSSRTLKSENDILSPIEKMKKYYNGSLMVTPNEGKVLEALHEAWDKFCDLGMSKEDFSDFHHALMACKRIIMARVARRAAPDIFKENE